MAIKGGRAGSVTALRAATERKVGEDSYLQRIPADDSMEVRFLTDPEEWQEYYEHYDQVMRYFPCTDDNCPGCMEGDKPQKKYLANVLLTDDGRVVPLVLPKTLVSRLLNRYERYATMKDRPYELIRTGSGLDTEYDVNPEVPSKLNTKKYTLLDLAAVLENQLTRAYAEAGEETPEPPKKGKGKQWDVAGRTSKTKAVEPEEEPDDEGDDDDDEQSDGVLSREELEGMSLRELRAYAKDDMGFTAAAIKGLDQDALVDLLLGDDEDLAEDDEDDEGDDEDDEAEVEEDEDEEEGFTEDSDEDDEEEGLTEDEIRELTLTELREVCDNSDVKYKKTEGRATLVKRLIEFIQVPF